MPPAPACPRAAAESGERTIRGRERLEALLADLGPRVRRGGEPRESPLRHPSGLAPIDALLEGGFPRGCLSEITGPPSSGRTSLVLSLLARATGAAGELAAVVDRADAFDPPSAEAAGVDLERILWARVPDEWRQTLRCTERLLETEGIPLVVLDLDTPRPTRSSRPSPSSPSIIPPAAWTRIARLAAGTHTALVVLSPRRLIGSQAEIVLEMKPTRPRFSGVPSLLEELEARAVLIRHRAAPVDREVALRLGAAPGASSA